MVERRIAWKDPRWPWQKHAARASLVRLGRAGSARAWILNLIQFFHWLSLLSVVLVGWVVVDHIDVLTDALGSRWQSYALLLSALLPGAAGIPPILMHSCEGWQLTPELGSTESGDGHDPVLRRMAYRILFSGLTLSQLLLPLAVFGLRLVLLIPLSFCALGVIVGPSRPLLPWKTNGVLLLPVAVPLAIAFAASLPLAALALWFWLDPPLTAAGFSPGVSLVPLLMLGAGGATEAIKAETTFNQWWHLVAILLLLAGNLVYARLLSIAL